MKTIAVLGASSRHEKFGNKCVRAYVAAGWQVFPVHPAETEIEGLPVFRRLADVPGELERISVYLPPAKTLEMLGEIAAKGAGEVWLNPGSADSRVLDEARRRGLAAIPGCSIINMGLSPSRFP